MRTSLLVRSSEKLANDPTDSRLSRLFNAGEHEPIGRHKHGIHSSYAHEYFIAAAQNILQECE